ncbi:MAG: LysR family transcriptional regulator [Anaerolineae bacterium]|nr:LysR family transcriptional regulator [Anaerolineae bacterium]
MLTLQELEVFLAAAEYKNFSEAGRQLHVSQSAVSQTIQKIESHYGTKLFLRTGHSMELSGAGELLMALAKELLANATRLEETMAAMHASIAGKINIGCSTTSGKYLLPRLIADFREQYSQVRLDVYVGGRESVIHKVIEGTYNFGVSSKLIEHPELEYVRFFTDEIALIAPADHPWAKYRRVLPDDLLDTPLILREKGSGTSEVLFEGLRLNDIVPEMLNVVMILGNTEAIILAVEEKIGVAFVSRLAAQRSLESGRCIEIEVEGLTLKRDLFIARSRHYPADRSQIKFWQFLKDRIAATSAEPSGSAS